jgi:hypothetical protein
MQRDRWYAGLFIPTRLLAQQARIMPKRTMTRPENFAV